MGTPTATHTPGIIALLRSPFVQRIRFSAESISITGDGYGRVAAALSDGRITVDDEVRHEVSIKGGKVHVLSIPLIMPHGANAMYNADKNVLVVKPTINLADVRDRGLVVHEMTHALIDLMHLSKSRGLHRTEGEGIAYIAQSLYKRFDGAVISKDLRFGRVADRISKRIIGHGRGMYFVSRDEMRELRDAVGQDKHYRHVRGKLHPSDG
jgi:hypothetical protein